MATLMTWDRLHAEPPEDSAHTDSWAPRAVNASNPAGAAARVTPPSGADQALAGRAGRDRQAAPGPLTDTARPPDSTTPSEPSPAEAGEPDEPVPDVLLPKAAESGRAGPAWKGCDRVHEVPAWLDHAPSGRTSANYWTRRFPTFS